MPGLRIFLYLCSTILVATLGGMGALSGGIGQNSHHQSVNLTSVASQPSTYLPFDLIASEYDLNGIMLNPKWGGQVDDNTFPDPNDTIICPKKDFSGEKCSSQPTNVDKPSFPHSLICGLKGVPKERVNGHVNWTVATYDGIIYFNNYSDDFDFTWTFKPRDGAGLTKKNPGSTPNHPEFIHAEFDVTETINGFITPTWKAIRDGFECFDDEPNCPANAKKARDLVDGRRAVITGLMGLDTEHGGYSELHPIYVLAIEVDPNPLDNKWILFIRSRGNEGFCASHDHPLKAIERFALMIPKPPDSQVTSARVIESSFSSTVKDNCPTLGFDDKSQQGEILIYDLPQNSHVGKPFSGPILEGEVRIEWSSSGPLTPFQRENVTPQMIQEQDEHFLTPEQRKIYIQRTRTQGLQALDSSGLFHLCPQINGELSLSKNNKFLSLERMKQARTKLRVGKVGRPGVESDIRQHNRAIFRELCLASNNKLQGCASMRRTRRSARHPGSRH